MPINRTSDIHIPDIELKVDAISPRRAHDRSPYQVPIQRSKAQKHIKIMEHQYTTYPTSFLTS